MKKQITLMALGLLTLAGGSWLAAQQREANRTTRGSDLAPLDAIATEAEVAAVQPVEEPAKVRRPSAASAASPRTTRSRPAQDNRYLEVADAYAGQAARFAEEASAYDAVRVAGQQIYLPAGPQRMTPEDAARMRAFQDAIKELRDAENTEEKTVARERVTKLVGEQLEADLDNREKELAAIEQRAKELRKQLEERKTAKPELLKMLVMLIDNPQVGLGIPPEWMHMLMRGQPQRYTPGFPIVGPVGATAIYPVAPVAPARPDFPQTVESRYREIVDENSAPEEPSEPARKR